MASNVFLIQQTPHEFILTFGIATPPIFATPPTPEQVAAIRSIPAKALGRVAMSPGRVVELLQLLQQQLMAHQQAQKQ